ncbi:MAG: isoprenylcysteine carboxylmethyltransferase family protein [Terracidiphilus sp.]
MGRTKCVVAGVFSIIFQFTLAILGWGGVRAFFAHPALRAMAASTVVIGAAAFFVGGSLSEGVKEDRENRWVLKVFAVIAMLLTFFAAFTDRVGFWTIDGDTTRWVGLAVYVIGAVLRLWPVYVLGNRFSGLVAIQPEHQLETRGIYSTIRNPSYLGMLVNAAGWALCFRSAVGLLLAMSLLIPLVARMHAEERLLREHFGEEYEEYFNRTWRLAPGIY